MSDTPLTDKIQDKHALQWFGIHAPIDRAMDESNKMREHARSLERHANAMAEAIATYNQLKMFEAIIAWRAFVKENT